MLVLGDKGDYGIIMKFELLWYTGERPLGMLYVF